MEIPLLDGSLATVSQGEVSTAEKALEMWSNVDGNDEHIAQNITGRVRKWISKMKNGHLPARLGWVAYKFVLWPGVKYGLATLVMPMDIAQRNLQKKTSTSYCS
jgi:hypothetical protein